MGSRQAVPLWQPLLFFLSMVVALFGFTMAAARLWTDGVWGIPDPRAPLVALALMIMVVGWWVGSRLGESRFIQAAIATALVGITTAAWFVLLLMLARDPCALCVDTHPQCCEAWGMIAAMGPGAMSVVFALSITISGIRRRLLVQREEAAE